MEENQTGKLPTSNETIEELLKKIQQLEAEKEKYLESLKRAKSDVLKISGEFEKKMQEIQEQANAELIYSLLSVLDSFELAFSKLPENEIYQGFYLVYAQLKDILEKFGLVEINPLGLKFDPSFHEVIANKKCEKENCSQEDDMVIVEVLSKGYFLKGRLLRPARVKVITHV